VCREPLDAEWLSIVKGLLGQIDLRVFVITKLFTVAEEAAETGELPRHWSPPSQMQSRSPKGSWRGLTAGGASTASKQMRQYTDRLDAESRLFCYFETRDQWCTFILASSTCTVI
jgi:hypothetical protein